jgi:branched-chain amino acid transport system ATP-binding protein
MSEALLAVNGLAAGYGASEVLRGIDLEVAAGEIVTVLGSNGAGKSTLNRTISGVLRATRGSIRFAGHAIEREKPAMIVARGLIHVPEARCVFPNLTIAENLDLGSYRRGRARRESNRARVFAIFPRLAERASQRAGTLSGGEQQMLAIGRGLMAEPELLILDEPSLGLSPRLVEELFALIRRINAEGIALLLVEQNVVQCLEVARRAYIRRPVGSATAISTHIADRDDDVRGDQHSDSRTHKQDDPHDDVMEIARTFMLIAPAGPSARDPCRNPQRQEDCSRVYQGNNHEAHVPPTAWLDSGIARMDAT